MNPGDPRPLLDRHAARVLTRWRERLRALPPSSALAHPDMLGPLMAPALARVRQEAAQPAEEAGAVGDGSEPVVCRCGLNPLVAFYLTGECATFDVLWGQADALPHLAPSEREQLCRALSQAWRRVATDEISLFCGVCLRRKMPEVLESRGDAPLSPAGPGACSGFRDTSSATGRRSGETRG